MPCSRADCCCAPIGLSQASHCRHAMYPKTLHHLVAHSAESRPGHHCSTSECCDLSVHRHHCPGRTENEKRLGKVRRFYCDFWPLIRQFLWGRKWTIFLPHKNLTPRYHKGDSILTCFLRAEFFSRLMEPFPG